MIFLNSIKFLNDLNLSSNSFWYNDKIFDTLMYQIG